jgi:ABC-2 type transport system permease protein
VKVPVTVADGTLVGLARITRLILRLDRVRLAVWVGVTVVVIVGSAASLLATYPDQAAIDSYGAVMSDNPALAAFAGPGYGLDDPNIGVILVNEVQLWGLVTVGLMSVFLVNRHTRAEEDAERADLLRSAVVGRHAVSAATIGIVTAAHVVLATGCGLGFVLLGYPVPGSTALALSYLVMGWMFVGVALVAAQLAGTGRGSLGLASSVLGLAFVVRAAADTARSPLRWLSPLSWPLSVRAFANERWWVLGLAVAFGVVMVVVGIWLSTRRDLGSGRLVPGAGPEHAGPSLRHPIGFVLHLHRWTIASWTAGMFVLGAVYGSVTDDIEQMMRENPIYVDLLGQAAGATAADSYLVTVMVMQALMVSGYLISAISVPHHEESASRVEVVLASAIGRKQWLGSYLVVAGLGAVLATISSGLGTGLSTAATTGNGDQITRLTAAGVATLPAVAVIGSIAVVLYGWRPRTVPMAWGVLGAVTVVAILAEVLRLPQWVRQVSPFTHLAGVPAEAVNWASVFWLLLLAGVLTVIGMWGFERRDIEAR